MCLQLSRRNTTEDEGAEEVPEAATQSHGLLRCDMLQGGSAAGIPGGIRQLAAARLHRIWLDVKVSETVVLRMTVSSQFHITGVNVITDLLLSTAEPAI